MRDTVYCSLKNIRWKNDALNRTTDDNLLVMPFLDASLFFHYFFFRSVACFLHAHIDISILLFRFFFHSISFFFSVCLSTSVFVVLFFSSSFRIWFVFIPFLCYLLLCRCFALSWLSRWFFFILFFSISLLCFFFGMISCWLDFNLVRIMGYLLWYPGKCVCVCIILQDIQGKITRGALQIRNVWNAAYSHYTNSILDQTAINTYNGHISNTSHALPSLYFVSRFSNTTQSTIWLFRS